MDLLKGLNKNQKEAVCSIKGPLLVVAGPGTGKTKVITHRISWLIKNRVSPKNILAVTFTNKAAQEMSERIISLTLNSEARPTIGTFHAIASNILRKNGEQINISPRFSILGEKQGLGIIKSSIEELGLDQRQFRPELIRNIISQKKSRLELEPQNPISKPDFFSKNFNLIREKYEQKLKELKALDFDDLMQKTIVLFKNFPEVLRLYQEKWPYIHIDEYQDTDQIQHQFVQLLSKSGNNICAVGDEDQSIYGFRGADFTNILEFENGSIRAGNVTLSMKKVHYAGQSGQWKAGELNIESTAGKFSLVARICDQTNICDRHRR